MEKLNIQELAENLSRSTDMDFNAFISDDGRSSEPDIAVIESDRAYIDEIIGARLVELVLEAFPLKVRVVAKTTDSYKRIRDLIRFDGYESQLKRVSFIVQGDPLGAGDADTLIFMPDTDSSIYSEEKNMEERQILKLQMKNGITGQLLQYETVDERKQRIKDMFTNINSLADSAPVGRLEMDSILAMVKTGEPDLDVLKDISGHFQIINIVLREKMLGITRKSKDEPISAVYKISRDFGLLDNDTLLDHPGVVDAGVFYTVLAAYFKSGLRKEYDDESGKEKIQRLREVLEQCHDFYERLETYREDRKHLRRTFRFVEETFEDSMLRIAENEEEEKELRSLAREIRSRSLEEGLFDSRMSESEFKQTLTDFLLNYIRPVFSDYPEFSRFGSLYDRFLDSAWESRLMIINDGPED